MRVQERERESQRRTESVEYESSRKSETEKEGDRVRE